MTATAEIVTTRIGDGLSAEAPRFLHTGRRNAVY
jgi:hypothetical protein